MNFYQPPFIPYQPGIAVPYQQVGNPEMVSPPDILNQQSYIENILRDNIGKLATIYMNFEGSQWGSKVFKGIIKGAGKDHIIIKEAQSETRHILLMVYLDYISFDERIEYEYPFRNFVKKEE